jgi:hypothetical protein
MDTKKNWTEEETVKLMEAVQPYERLYNTAHEKHKDRGLVAEAFTNVAKQFGIMNEIFG